MFARVICSYIITAVLFSATVAGRSACIVVNFALPHFADPVLKLVGLLELWSVLSEGLKILELDGTTFWARISILSYQVNEILALYDLGDRHLLRLHPNVQLSRESRPSLRSLRQHHLHARP
jgi:hypothetical protein